MFLAADGRRLDRHGAGRIVRKVARHAGITKVVYGGAHGAHLDLGGARGEEVADAVRMVRESGLPNRTDAMFATIEGDWD